MTRSLSLGELRDLEAALQAGDGPELWPAEGQLPQDAETPVLVRAWLGAVYQGRSRPGARYRGALTKLAWGFAVAACLLGVGAARYALHYDGTEPVNVLVFLTCLVLVQIAFLFLAAIVWFLRSTWSGFVSVQTVGGLSRQIADWLETRIVSVGNKRDSPLALRALYRPVMTWYVVFLMQWFGVVFNAAVLLTSLGTITFTDLAFAWATTLQVDAHAVNTAARILGTPFPALVPSVEIVQATRYSRLEARYAGGDRDRRSADLAATSAWWPFLAAALLCYGMLPRLCLMFASYVVYRRSLQRVPLHAFEIDRLVRGIQARIRSQAAIAAALPQHPMRLQRGVRPDFAAQSGESGVAIVWRDAPWTEAQVRELVLRCRGAEPQAVFRTEGDLDGRKTAMRLPAEGTIYVLVDAFETLQKALIRFLSGLRQYLTPERLIVILPVQESVSGLALPSRPEERAYWRKYAEQLGDPFLGAEVAGA